MQGIISHFILKLIGQNSSDENGLHSTVANRCSIAIFKKQLAIEKRRAERLNYKSSLAVFHLSNGKNSRSNTHKLIDVVCDSLRATDLVCSMGKNCVIVLLPDTNNQGSELVCKKIITNVVKKTPHVRASDIEFEILTYPEKNTEEKLEQKFSQANSRPFEVNEKAKNNPQLYKSYLDNLNLSISSYNGSVIAWPILNTFFWDQDLIKNQLTVTQMVLKRLIDLIGSLLWITLLFPTLLLISIIIKISSRGPILYKQERVGFRGKPFMLYKFRTMRTNNDQQQHKDYMKKFISGKLDEVNHGTSDDPYYKMKDDPRITRVGRFLRKTGLDEIPQLINVFKGEMSIIGPRPPIPYEVREYQNWHYRRLFDIKPGITGLWQISGRNRTTFNEMVRLDLTYIANWSLLFDFKILLKTIWNLVLADGI
jgi:lipopolysaccharide/colanic/teichoic acid biosynthesis glycosyltransferase